MIGGIGGEFSRQRAVIAGEREAVQVITGECMASSCTLCGTVCNGRQRERREELQLRHGKETPDDHG